MSYNAKRLEWHLDDERKERTLQISVVGLVKVASEAFAFRSIVLLLLTPRAKIHQRYLRGFCFSGQTGLHPIEVHLHGWPGREHRLYVTPHKSRSALIERLIKSKGHGGTRPLMKRINPSWALGLSSLNKSRRVKCKRKMEQSGVYPPLENLCL